MAIAIQVDDAGGFGAAHGFVQPGQHPAHTGLGKGTGARDLDHENLIGFALPVFERPAAEVASADESGFVIVGAEIGGAGMRDIDGDHGNARLQKLARDGGGHRLVGLEFDDEVDLFADQLIGVAVGGAGIVAIVENDELDAGGLRGPDQSGSHFAGERGILALGGVAQPIAAIRAQVGKDAVLILADFFQEAAHVQGVEKAEAGDLVEAGPGHHVAQAEHLAFGAEGGKNLGGVDQGLHDVARVGGVIHCFAVYNAFRDRRKRGSRAAPGREIYLLAMNTPMVRRAFGKAVIGSALSAAAAAAPADKKVRPRPWPPGIKISVQIGSEPSDDDLQFVLQVGARYVNIGTSGGDQATAENFIRLKNKVESAGLRVWNIGNSDVHNMEEVTLNLPGRDQKIEQYKQFSAQPGPSRAALHHLRAHGQRDLELSGWRYCARRGRARAFHLATATGHWADKEFKGPLTHGRVYTEKEIWDNYEYFIRQVAPVAEEQDIYIGIHPDDPPVPMLGGVPRCIFGNFEGYKRALEIANSPNVGVCLCCGTWLEGGELMGMDVVGAIRYFGRMGKLWKIHFRNVSVAGPAFRGGVRGQRLHGDVEDHARPARSGFRRRGDRRPFSGDDGRSTRVGGLHGGLHEGATRAGQCGVRITATPSAIGRAIAHRRACE